MKNKLEELRKQRGIKLSIGFYRLFECGFRILSFGGSHCQRTCFCGGRIYFNSVI